MRGDLAEPCRTALGDSINQRPRVSAAVLRNENREILLVQHQRQNGDTYWQLPGGGVLPDETPEVAVLRELCEETGLQGEVIHWLFTIPYKYGTSTTFLVRVQSASQATLGADPEEEGADHRKLVGVAWRPIAEERTSPEVEILGIVLGYLKLLD